MNLPIIRMNPFHPYSFELYLSIYKMIQTRLWVVFSLITMPCTSTQNQTNLLTELHKELLMKRSRR